MTLDELEVDGEGIQGIAEFMGDSGGEAHDGINALGLDAFFEGYFVFGDIGEDDNVTTATGSTHLRGDGNHVETQEAAFRIGEFDFASEHGLGGSSGIDALGIHGAGEVGHHFPEAGSANVIFLKPNDSEGGVVGVLHDAIGINNEDAILNSVKDGFLEFALTGEALNKNTEIDRIEVFKSAKDFIKPGIFHKVVLAKVLDTRMTILDATPLRVKGGKAVDDLGRKFCFQGRAEGFVGAVGGEQGEGIGIACKSGTGLGEIVG